MVQKDKEKIAHNQMARRRLKLRRLKNQLKKFADLIPTETLKAINSI